MNKREIKEIENNAKLDIRVTYVHPYWDEHKEDFLGGYWCAQVIRGLEPICKAWGGEVRPKDLNNEGHVFGEEIDLVVRQKAIDNLKEQMHKYGIHGKMHIMSEKEMNDFLDELERSGRIVLR